jgi:hypothetical protein
MQCPPELSIHTALTRGRAATALCHFETMLLRRMLALALLAKGLNRGSRDLACIDAHSRSGWAVTQPRVWLLVGALPVRGVRALIGTG